MAKGRPPDPKRERRGTGHRPLVGQRPPVEVAVSKGLDLTPPDGLPEATHELWTTVCSELAPRGLTTAQLPLVEMLVKAMLRHRQAGKAVEKYGVMIPYRVGGSVRGMPNPMLRVEKDSAATYLRLAETLGLSPAAQVRLGLMQVAGQSMLLTIAERVARAVAAGHDSDR
jgi:P27 family predicted phage terminase small subunit